MRINHKTITSSAPINPSRRDEIWTEWSLYKQMLNLFISFLITWDTENMLLSYLSPCFDVLERMINAIFCYVTAAFVMPRNGGQVWLNGSFRQTWTNPSWRLTLCADPCRYQHKRMRSDSLSERKKFPDISVGANHYPPSRALQRTLPIISA